LGYCCPLLSVYSGNSFLSYFDTRLESQAAHHFVESPDGCTCSLRMIDLEINHLDGQGLSELQRWALAHEYQVLCRDFVRTFINK